MSVTCPKCGKEYGSTGCHECPFCCHEWDDGEPYCFAHGEPVKMLLQEPGTPEQKFCGTRYVCQKCTGSVLFPSPELKHQLADMAAKQVKATFNKLAAPFGVSI